MAVNHSHNSLICIGLIRIPSRAGNLKAELPSYVHYKSVICCSDSSGITGNDSNSWYCLSV